MKILQIIIGSPIAQATGWALLHSLWEGAIVSAVLAVVVWITRSARVRYIAACLAMFAILLCFLGTLIALVPHELGSGARNSILMNWPNRVNVPPAAAASIRLADILPWLAPIWIIGVVVFYLRHIASWLTARRLRTAGICCAPHFWQERLEHLTHALRLSRPVALLESSLVATPVVIGHLRPVILIPIGLLTGMSVEQIESILLHELAHIRRYDYLVNMVQTSIESLLFYHPLIWWISRVIRTEREHCCDDWAATISGNTYEYARALTALERSRWGASESVLAATGGSLVKRIRRLLIPAERRSFVAPVLSVGLLLLAAVAGLMIWQVKAQAQSSPAPDPYTKWLQEDVAYIILPAEREAFLRLETNAERDQFIQQFWERRNPTPGASENPFKREHYRRIAFANLNFPTAEGTPGWKTDRGRIYITFGPPNELDRHPDGDATTPYPWERWKYRWIEGIGNDVSMEFVDSTRTGNYRMTTDPNEGTGQQYTRPQPNPR
jgi:GWxTD domain-containing protein